LAYCVAEPVYAEDGHEVRRPGTGHLVGSHLLAGQGSFIRWSHIFGHFDHVFVVSR
jgi:hypothetical protein